MNRCVVVANGSHQGMESLRGIITSSHAIIAVDGGLEALKSLNIMPTLIIGDYDSVSKDLLDEYKEKDIPCMTFPKRKDATDSELAIDYAIEQGPSELYLLGMTGKRMDHGMANIHMLKRVPEHIKASIIDAYNEIFYSRKDFTLKGYKGKNLSIIPISPVVENISTSGLDYPLNHENLYFENSRGVSNVIVSNHVQITTTSGEYFVIISKD
jgi:thiamine pyrophosphokinase